MMNPKLLSLLFALPVLITNGSNSIFRDGLLNSPDSTLFFHRESESVVMRDSLKLSEQLVAARGEQPGKCQLLGICD
jgi:hypothetical protein